MLYSFPPRQDKKVTVEQLEHFCFPVGVPASSVAGGAGGLEAERVTRWTTGVDRNVKLDGDDRPVSLNFYCFRLTDGTGQPIFCYCIAINERIEDLPSFFPVHVYSEGDGLEAGRERAGSQDSCASGSREEGQPQQPQQAEQRSQSLRPEAPSAPPRMQESHSLRSQSLRPGAGSRQSPAAGAAQPSQPPAYFSERLAAQQRRAEARRISNPNADGKKGLAASEPPPGAAPVSGGAGFNPSSPSPSVRDRDALTKRATRAGGTMKRRNEFSSCVGAAGAGGQSQNPPSYLEDAKTAYEDGASKLGNKLGNIMSNMLGERDPKKDKDAPARPAPRHSGTGDAGGAEAAAGVEVTPQTVTLGGRVCLRACAEAESIEAGGASDGVIVGWRDLGGRPFGEAPSMEGRANVLWDNGRRCSCSIGQSLATARRASSRGLVRTRSASRGDHSPAGAGAVTVPEVLSSRQGGDAANATGAAGAASAASAAAAAAVAAASAAASAAATATDTAAAAVIRCATRLIPPDPQTLPKPTFAATVTVTVTACRWSAAPSRGRRASLCTSCSWRWPRRCSRSRAASGETC